MQLRRNLFLAHIFSLFIGGGIYLFFRTEKLLMFKWINSLGAEGVLNKIRLITLNFRPSIPDWLLYSLPDGLYVFSYVSLMLAVWNMKFTLTSIFWILNIPLIIIVSEIGQLLLIVPGTYDIKDLSFYLLGTILPFFCLRKKVITVA